jgi:hypothetical protein
MRCPFNGTTKNAMDPLELVSFDLWGPSHIQSVGGKVYFMPVFDSGTSYKYGTYLMDKSDVSIISAFNSFRIIGEATTGQKICRLRTDHAYNSIAWTAYCEKYGIIHKLTVPYSSVQNGLAKHTICTTMDDVCTLL